MSLVGGLVAGRFRLERPLGHGGMGELWIALDERLATRCALKFLQATSDPDAEARFEQEARAAAQLRSPNVVAMLDHGTSDGRAYIAMELLEGEDLGKRVRRMGPLDPNETLRLITHVGRALTRAHALGLVHRDLKPANIFIVRDEEGLTAKVLDFGIAKRTSEVRLDSAALDGGGGTDVGLGQTVQGHTLGTPTHMSPEHVNGLPVDHRTDLWALGVVAYECLTGQLPFRSRSLGELVHEITSVDPAPPSATRPELPREVDTWMTRALAKPREARFSDAKTMTDALASALGIGAADASTSLVPAPSEPDAPLSLPFARTVALATTRPRRRTAIVVGAAVISLVALAAGGALLVSSTSSGRSVDERGPEDVATAEASTSPREKQPPFREWKLRDLSIGVARTCALFEGGQVACWGADPRADLPFSTPSPSAVLAFAGDEVTELTQTAGVACVRTTSRGLRCFRGDRLIDQFIENHQPTRLALAPPIACGLIGEDLECIGLPGSAPGVPVVQARRVASFAAGASVGCVLDPAGEPRCWLPPSGMVTPEEAAAALVPKPFPALRRTTSLAAGAAHVCGVLPDGHVGCIGDPASGVLGILDERVEVEIAPGITQRKSTVPPGVNVVPDIEDAVKVVAGARFTCALTRARDVYCWGENDVGQLGRGTLSASEHEPRKVLADIEILGAGMFTTCAARADGEILCWGGGDGGVLGHAAVRVCANNRSCQPTPTPPRPW